MQFNDSTTEDGVIQEINRICNATDNTYSLKAKTARVNAALDRFFTLALLSDGDWQFDDTNQTTLPIGVADLVSGQYDYAFASELLMVTKVLVKDNTGNWLEIRNIDQNDFASNNIYTQPNGNSGTPYAFDILGNSLLLLPTPNYNSTGGLKVVFKRNASKFVSTDTTKVPGIPTLFHPYLCRQASLPFLIEKKLPQLANVSAQIAVDEQAIEDFMSHRDGTRKTRITNVFRNPR